VRQRWFPEGPDDPRLMILKVQITRAEHWDIDKRAMIKLLEKGADGGGFHCRRYNLINLR